MCLCVTPMSRYRSKQKNGLVGFKQVDKTRACLVAELYFFFVLRLLDGGAGIENRLSRKKRRGEGERDRKNY
jgi:hypothetical protein